MAAVIRASLRRRVLHAGPAAVTLSHSPMKSLQVDFSSASTSLLAVRLVSDVSDQLVTSVDERSPVACNAVSFPASGGSDLQPGAGEVHHEVDVTAASFSWEAGATQSRRLAPPAIQWPSVIGTA